MKKYSDIILAFLVPLLRPVLFIACGLLLLTIPPFKGKTLAEVSRWWAFVAIAANIITAIVLYFLAKREGKKYRDLFHYTTGERTSAKQILIAIALMLPLGMIGLFGFSYLFYGYMPTVMVQPLPIWAAITAAIILPVSIVFTEIPLYIGYSAQRLQSFTGSRLLSYAYPLFFYALQHSFMPLIFEPKHIISRFFIFIPLLIMIAVWSHRKKNLVPLMIGHGILDLSVGVQIVLLSVYPSLFEAMKSAA